MAVIREAAAGLAGLFSGSNSQGYHKLSWESSDDPESASPGKGRRGWSGRSFGRWSLKSLLTLAGGIWLLTILVFSASRYNTQNQNSPSTSPSTPNTGKPGLPEPEPPGNQSGQGHGEGGEEAGGDHIVDNPSDDGINAPIQSPPPYASDVPAEIPEDVPDHRRLRIIMPADDPDVNLCKSILSIMANDYPAPVIANWGREFHKTDKWFGGSHLGKLDGTLEVLEALYSDDAPVDERLYPDDLVLILDAYDIWFQLPPTLLVRRWLAQNAVANERIRSAWSAQAEGAAAPPTQSVILSTQKKCWPTKDDGSDTHCDILPQSTLREDLYGPDTDKPGGPMHNRRPRYINSGAMIGPAKDVLRMLHRAVHKVELSVKAGKHLFSDQGILGEILGEQEVWRKEQRERNARVLSGKEAPDVTLESELREEGGADTYEFSVGLDYQQDLFIPTVFEEDDGEYLILGDQAAVHASSVAHKVNPPRLDGVPEDIEQYATPPLILAGVPEQENTKSWAEVPMYADYWSTQVPVGVHHNAHRGGMKPKRLREWWNKTWFFPHLRNIITTKMVPRESLEPLVTIPASARQDGNTERDLVYWAVAADAQKPMARIFDPDVFEEGIPEADWNTLCVKPGKSGDPWWDVVFQDGKGEPGHETEGTEADAEATTSTSVDATPKPKAEVKVAAAA